MIGNCKIGRGRKEKNQERSNLIYAQGKQKALIQQGIGRTIKHK